VPDVRRNQRQPSADYDSTSRPELKKAVSHLNVKMTKGKTVKRISEDEVQKALTEHAEAMLR
jgi:hypothetical protein